MKDVNEVHKSNEPQYVEVVEKEAKPIMLSSEFDCKIGDFLVIGNNKYKLVDTKKLDISHRKIPGLYLVSE